MLDLVQIRKTFNPKTVNEKVALDGLNLHMDDGDFVTVIGGNGAGKSTMLNAIAGVWPVDSGSITIDGTDVTRLSEHRRAALLGRVFQDPMTGTAAKVLELSEQIVAENHLMTLMVTHNMRDAIRYGNRLIMMHEGRIILDIAGEEKKHLTVEMLMDAFARTSGEAFANDRILLS